MESQGPSRVLYESRLSSGMLARTGLLAVAVGGAAALAVALSHDRGSGWGDGLRWLLYMLGFGGIAAILGLVFGVPRARAEFSATSTERYSSNSNLEQISDWLTKLLVGAGLVELKSIAGVARGLGDYLGAGMSLGNPSGFALSAVVYGLGVGFIIGYLWTRLRLRLLLESSDQAAAEASKVERIAESLKKADRASGKAGEKDATLRQLADAAVSARLGGQSSLRPRILWVDDRPSNNESLASAFREVDIAVDLALSTDSALQLLHTSRYELVITDLGRREAGADNPNAGVELVQAVRALSLDLPIIVYGTQRAVDRSEELMRVGATVVTDRPSQVFDEVVRRVAAS